MPHKRVLFNSAARDRVLRGATALADAVRVTLGPKSKSVLIQRKWGHPLVCNDGVTIAKEMDLENPDENLGVQALREAAEGAAGIIDPTKVVRVALENAVSVAGVLLLSEATLTEIEEPRPEREEALA